MRWMRCLAWKRGDRWFAFVLLLRHPWNIRRAASAATYRCGREGERVGGGWGCLAYTRGREWEKDEMSRLCTEVDG